jgi:hypothetical protein
MVTKIEFQSFKYDIKSNEPRKDDLKEMERKHYLNYMKQGLIEDIRTLLILNSPPQEKDKEDNRIESQPHIENILTHF